MKKMKLREVEWIFQGHIAGELADLFQILTKPFLVNTNKYSIHLLSATEINISKIPLKRNGEYYLDFSNSSDGLVVLP